MNILIIGGTQFVGRAMTEEALSRGHDVTLFHRGQTNPDLFRGRVKEILGDRKADLSGLRGTQWDAVIDCVGYEPGPVRESCLAVEADAYAFVSTISVYGVENPDESTPTIPLPDGADLTAFTAETYGPLKVLCEEEVSRRFPETSLLVRAGLQCGPNDHTDRFNDWVDRILHRPRIAVPDDDMPWQQIDARDTAAFTLGCLESKTYGVFNVTGESTPMVDVLERVRKTIAPHCELVKVDPVKVEEFAKPWQELTLWLPESARGGFPLVTSIERAKGAGLRLRPIEETVQDIRDVLVNLPVDRARRSGLPLEKEEAILAALG